jgi:hypothetical protein
VPDPSKRFLTIVLGLGIIVLVAGIALGEREGNHVIGQVTEKRIESIAPVTVTPAPLQTGANAYGPDWKRTDVMSAAPDPQFPDPRVPPVPPPTPPPPPKFTPPPLERPTPTPTPNMNVPIWRRYAPLPTVPPSGAPTGAAPQPSASPASAADASASPHPV